MGTKWFDSNLIFHSCAALCWVSETGWEVLINGQKRGVPPKHRFNSKFRCGPTVIPFLSLSFRNAAQPDALKDIVIGAFPHHPHHPWPPSASVCLLVSFFLFVPYSTFPSESASYHEVKQAVTTYQAAKRCLLGPNAPFAGWVISGEEWESFNARGDLRSEAQHNQSRT